MPINPPRQLVVRIVCTAAASALCATVSASELLISRDALQTLVVTEIFKDHGRWYFAKGACYAFLERPRVSLGAGRLIINGHLSSRLGVEVSGSCMGADFASDVQVSGRFVGAGSHITLNDIRMENVQDELTRQALDLLQSSAGSSLPKVVDIDLLQVLQPTTLPDTPIKVEVTALQISAITTQPNSVTVHFDVKLNAH